MRLTAGLRPTAWTAPAGRLESMPEAPLAERLVAGETRALARAIRMVEDRDPGIASLLRDVRGQTGRARVIGVTGPPGSGKSTLCDQIIERWRVAGHRVGVI